MDGSEQQGRRLYFLDNGATDKGGGGGRVQSFTSCAYAFVDKIQSGGYAISLSASYFIKLFIFYMLLDIQKS
jgi:hypothetical protein